MKRSEFFTEMGKGFFQTVKEITSPFIKEDLNKMDVFADKVVGMKWYEIGLVDSFRKEGIHDVFVSGEPFVLVKGQDMRVYRKVCPSCDQMMHWISFEMKLKCMNCEQSFELLNQGARIGLSSHPIKIVEEKLFLGKY
ncbi:hypothetical protein ABE096_06930 [Robertmurraya massiliosenegalensis]|uniref:hypothetical protein n=1 Tax=Robertmurraya TaxID=2837507 RepID=UPI0039A6CA85